MRRGVTGAVGRVGSEALAEIEDYFHRHHHEALFALSDLRAWRRGERSGDGPPTVWGYRTHEGVIAAQLLFPGGRWLPHYADDAAVEPLLRDALPRRPRWTVGARRVMDVLVPRVLARGRTLSYDAIEDLRYVDREHLRPHPLAGVRRAEEADVEAIADMRCLFEREYFRLRTGPIPSRWCLEAARRYVADGTYVAERDGRAVAMAATEARIPEVTQIGAVYTRARYRGMGLARGVVSALCEAELCTAHAVRRVTLNVHPGNAPARRVYDALGFRYWDQYRMCRFA